MTKKTTTEPPEQAPHADSRPRGRQLVTLIPGDLLLEHREEACEYVVRQLRLHLEQVESAAAGATSEQGAGGEPPPDGLDPDVLASMAARDLARPDRPGGPGDDELVRRRRRFRLVRTPELPSRGGEGGCGGAA